MDAQRDGKEEEKFNLICTILLCCDIILGDPAHVLHIL